jgi:hypothetical protein
VLVDCLLDDPEHDRAEQHDSGEFHLAILLARAKARPGSPRSLTAAPQWNVDAGRALGGAKPA